MLINTVVQELLQPRLQILHLRPQANQGAALGSNILHGLNSSRLQSLPRVLQDHPELRNVGRLTLLQSFRCVKLVLWDETERRLVSFREARASAAYAPVPA